MLVLFVVALVGSALARPQVILTPSPFQQPLHALPANPASLPAPIRSFAPSVPLRSASAPAIVPVPSSGSPLSGFINDSPAFAPSAHLAPVGVPVRPLIHAAPAFAPSARLAPALVPLRAAPVFASAAHLAPAVAPLRSVNHDVPAFSPISPLAPAQTPFRNLNPAAPILAPASHAAPAITPFRTLINDASSPSAAPAFNRPAITTVQRTFLADESGQFSLSHTDSAGSSFQEVGTLAPTNDGLDKVLIKSGSYSYTSPDGTPVSVSYKADALGFHPTSSAISLPTQPIQSKF